jgi:hypothetical protein
VVESEAEGEKKARWKENEGGGEKENTQKKRRIK